MKYIYTILFLFLSILSIAQEIVSGKVVKVADGDTITILTADFTQIKVRLHGIDCPEKSQDFGNKAKQFTSNQCFGKVVMVKITDTDRYGRSIGVVTLQNGLTLNKELLKAGLAWHYKHYDQSKEYSDLEIIAKNQKLGIWSLPNAVAPWDFRRFSR